MRIGKGENMGKLASDVLESVHAQAVKQLGWSGANPVYDVLLTVRDLEEVFATVEDQKALIETMKETMEDLEHLSDSQNETIEEQESKIERAGLEVSHLEGIVDDLQGQIEQAQRDLMDTSDG